MNLKEIRAKKGLSQGMVAREAGITNAFYSQIECGVRRPSVDVAKRLAGVLGIAWTDFFEEECEERGRGN